MNRYVRRNSNLEMEAVGCFSISEDAKDFVHFCFVEGRVGRVQCVSYYYHDSSKLAIKLTTFNMMNLCFNEFLTYFLFCSSLVRLECCNFFFKRSFSSLSCKIGKIQV